MANVKVTLEDFYKALLALNSKLSKCNMHITIKSIGGYAMLVHGLRESNGNSGYTEDIDSVTKPFKQHVYDLIAEVAHEQDLVEDWLNNDPMKMNEVKDVIDQLDWELNNKYSNITVYVADIESLILLKVRAVEGGGYVPRKTDKNDLIKLLRFIGINNIDAVLNDNRTKFIENYTLCFNYLNELREW